MSEKLIEEIIEIVLGNASCEHQEQEKYPRGPRYDDVTYNLNNEQEVIRKCVALIKKEVPEEWIDKKAKELHDKLWPGEKCGGHCSRQKEIKNFILSIVEKIQKPAVAEDWIRGEPYWKTDIKKKITEKWIEGKAMELYAAMQEFVPHSLAGKICWIASNTNKGEQDRKDFICKIVEEIHGKI